MPATELDDEEHRAAAERFVILLGVDYSEVSRLALQQACRQAAHHKNCELHVLEVASLTLPRALTGRIPLPESEAEPLARLRAWLAEVVAASRYPVPSSAPNLVAHVLTNADGDELCALAAELEADLVVVGVNPSNAWAMQVASACTSSVLIVRSRVAR